MDSINKRKEKLPLSFLQEVLQESGFKINMDSDDEEEEEEPTKDEEKKEDIKNENEDKKEEIKEVKEESVKKDN